ncbi:MAG: esterase-like activity of phytase family protein [Aliihoeflea sp.]
MALRAAARRLAAGCFAVLALAAAPALGEPAFDVELTFLPIDRFRIGTDEARFGPFEFLGGFEMQSPLRRFGQLSSVRFLSPGSEFVGVADHGHWFFGAVARDEAGVPVGMSRFSMQRIIGDDGQPVHEKHYADAEGLSVHDGIATVSFERDHRVVEYVLEPGGMGAPVGELDFLIPEKLLGYNAGIETVARAPDDGHLEGARIVIAERAADAEGNIQAAILEGPERGRFWVVRSGNFDITDGVFLPDGDLLLLERRFSLPLGVAMRIRRIAGDHIMREVLVDGPVLYEADMTHQIDNMESIDWWRREDGALVVALMSDDNQSRFQRSLYLEFVLSGE